MKKVKIIVTLIFLFLLLTGCSNEPADKESDSFIRSCNAKPGCKYKVWSDECVCDKTHTYIPYTSR